MLELSTVRRDFPPGSNIIVGQSHFIKTAEDLYEAIVTAVPQAKFGLAFNGLTSPVISLQYRPTGPLVPVWS
jgi:adenosine/AMP kinase